MDGASSNTTTTTPTHILAPPTGEMTTPVTVRTEDSKVEDQELKKDEEDTHATDYSGRFSSWRNRRQRGSSSSLLDSFRRPSTASQSSHFSAAVAPVASETEQLQKYEDLMSAPSTKISFVILQLPIHNTQDDKTTKQQDQQGECCSDANATTTTTPMLRTLWRQAGIDLIHNAEKKQFEVTSVAVFRNGDIDNDNDKDTDTDDTPPSSTPQPATSSPLVWPTVDSSRQLLAPGTVLESINASPCRRSCSTLDDVWNLLDASLRERQRTTLTFALVDDTNDEIFDNGGNDKEKEAREDAQNGKDELEKQEGHHIKTDEGTKCWSKEGTPTEEATSTTTLSSSPSSSFSTQTNPLASQQQSRNCVHQAILIFNAPAAMNEVETGGPLTELASSITLPTLQCERKNYETAKIQTTKSQGNKVLVLDAVPRQHWLSDTCLQSGDVVLCINQVPGFELNSDDASLVARTMSLTHPYVSLKTYGPVVRRRNRMESVRRAAVGAAGGTLVGVGGVLMVTPLHPIGHAMAIGGVGVLGLEFEGPRKAMQSIKKSFRFHSHQSPPTENNGNDVSQEPGTTDNGIHKEERENQ